MLTSRAAAPMLRRAQRCVRPCAAAATSTTHIRPRAARPSTRSHSSASSSTPLPRSSVSPEEVAHFNGLAAAWWDPHGSSRLLHQMNPLRHDFIRLCLSQQQEEQGKTGELRTAAAAAPPPPPQLPARILDVGCGGGIFAESAARLASTTSVTAIDPSAEVLAVARAHARRDPALQNKLRYVQTSIEDLVAGRIAGQPERSSAEATSTASTAFTSTSTPPLLFDMISLFEVIEHVAIDPGTFLAQCSRLLRPGGWLVGSTMARTWTSWLTTIVAAEDVLGIVPRGTHDWAKYINADELAAHFDPATGAACADGTAWEGPLTFQGVAYVPGLGWQVVPGGERLGNYFFGIRKGQNGMGNISTDV